jgi:uncharacterized protein
VLTTEAVLWELLNAFAARKTRGLAYEVYREIHADPSIEVTHAGEGSEARAIQLYADHHDKDWGITDCFSFVVMQQRGLAEALTADKHFTQADFTALLLHDSPR